MSLTWTLGVDILDLDMRQVEPAAGNGRSERYSRVDFTLQASCSTLCQDRSTLSKFL